MTVLSFCLVWIWLNLIASIITYRWKLICVFFGLFAMVTCFYLLHRLSFNCVYAMCMWVLVETLGLKHQSVFFSAWVGMYIYIPKSLNFFKWYRNTDMGIYMYGPKRHGIKSNMWLFALSAFAMQCNGCNQGDTISIAMEGFLTFAFDVVEKVALKQI